MKTGIKKAAIVMAAIALLSACGSNFKVETNPDLGQTDFERLHKELYPKSSNAEGVAEYMCEALEERGEEGFNSIRSKWANSVDEKAIMIDMYQAAINWKCPEFAK